AATGSWRQSWAAVVSVRWPVRDWWRSWARCPAPWVAPCAGSWSAANASRETPSGRSAAVGLAAWPWPSGSIRNGRRSALSTAPAWAPSADFLPSFCCCSCRCGRRDGNKRPRRPEVRPPRCLVARWLLRRRRDHVHAPTLAVERDDAIDEGEQGVVLGALDA